MNRILRFIRDDAGADLVEYVLIVGLVSLAAITALGSGTSGLVGAINGLIGNLELALEGIVFPTP